MLRTTFGMQHAIGVMRRSANDYGAEASQHISCAFLRVVEDISSCNCPRFVVDRIGERFPCGIDAARLVNCALPRVEVVQPPLRAVIGERRFGDVAQVVDPGRTFDELHFITNMRRNVEVAA